MPAGFSFMLKMLSYLDGWDGIKSVEIAITKYHLTDGTTVSIPEDQRKWEKFTFKHSHSGF